MRLPWIKEPAPLPRLAIKITLRHGAMIETPIFIATSCILEDGFFWFNLDEVDVFVIDSTLVQAISMEPVK